MLKQAAIGLWLAPIALSWGHYSAVAETYPQLFADVPRIECPRDLPTLVDRLLIDLPSYMNRVRTRSDILKSFIVLAGRPELEPLSLLPFAQTNTKNPPQTQQVFFTVLQRRYERNRMVYLQEYHWLFLAQTPKDWRFVTLYSTFGPYPATPAQPPLAPHNNSDGNAAVAIRDWLSDCRAGQLVQISPRSLKRSNPTLP